MKSVLVTIILLCSITSIYCQNDYHSKVRIFFNTFDLILNGKVVINGHHVANLNQNYDRVECNLYSLGEIDLKIQGKYRSRKRMNRYRKFDISIGVKLKEGETLYLELKEKRRLVGHKLQMQEVYPTLGEYKYSAVRFDGRKRVFYFSEHRQNPLTKSVSEEIKNNHIYNLIADVDINIPVSEKTNPNRIALIIGNEDYTGKQSTLQPEANVPFAVNDARIFKEYCVKTLGVKEQNVFYLINATAAEMYNKIELVSEILSRLDGQGELIFYYAGHGHPDENTREPYLIPVDVNASRLSSAIKLHDVYKTLAQTNAKRITVFLDACFTGGGRESGLLAARLVRVSPREEPISGNMVVFAATSDDQTALPYTMQQHGMFTYFLLKKLQETSGDVSYGDLDDYLRRNVSIESLRVNHRPQDPNTLISQQVANAWRLWLLK